MPTGEGSTTTETPAFTSSSTDSLYSRDVARSRGCRVSSSWSVSPNYQNSRRCLSDPTESNNADHRSVRQNPSFCLQYIRSLQHPSTNQGQSMSSFEDLQHSGLDMKQVFFIYLAMLDRERLLARTSDMDFPHDLFEPILSHVEDMTFLWTTCRAVSRDFTRAAERAFLANHLRKTHLIIDVGEWNVAGGKKVSFCSDFTLDRIDPLNNSRAIFAEKECTPELRTAMILALSLRMKLGNPPHKPRVIVQIGREMNDTAVPELEFDYDKLELSVDWKGMCSAFFREESEIDKQMWEWVTHQAYFLKEKKAMVHDGQMTQEEFRENIFQSWDKAVEDTRRELRHERIRREILENGVEWVWCGKEDASMRRLKAHRDGLGSGLLPSDESKGEDEVDITDEHQSDEWYTKEKMSSDND